MPGVCSMRKGADDDRDARCRPDAQLVTDHHQHAPLPGVYFLAISHSRGKPWPLFITTSDALPASGSRPIHPAASRGGRRGERSGRLGSELLPDPRVVAEAWDAWHAEVDFATQFVADASTLDITADDPLNQHGSGGGSISLRERIDGRIGE